MEENLRKGAGITVCGHLQYILWHLKAIQREPTSAKARIKETRRWRFTAYMTRLNASSQKFMQE